MTNNNLSHVAIILDGNKRWAIQNNLSNIKGYKEGFENIKNIVSHSLKINLSHLTLYTLSSENFNRPSINMIYEIIYGNFASLLDKIIKKNNIKINIFGSRVNIPNKINDIFDEAEKLTINNNALHLNLAFNYGFKDEIKEVLKKFQENIHSFDIRNENEIKKLFYLGNIPDPEILIRTGGYQRLSNFIMFNLTYTELFFTKTLWPNFTTIEYENIIKNYNNIDRKYGL